MNRVFMMIGLLYLLNAAPVQAEQPWDLSVQVFHGNSQYAIGANVELRVVGKASVTKATDQNGRAMFPVPNDPYQYVVTVTHAQYGDDMKYRYVGVLNRQDSTLTINLYEDTRLLVEFKDAHTKEYLDSVRIHIKRKDHPKPYDREVHYLFSVSSSTTFPEGKYTFTASRPGYRSKKAKIKFVGPTINTMELRSLLDSRFAIELFGGIGRANDWDSFRRNVREVGLDFVFRWYNLAFSVAYWDYPYGHLVPLTGGFRIPDFVHEKVTLAIMGGYSLGETESGVSPDGIVGRVSVIWHAPYHLMIRANAAAQQVENNDEWFGQLTISAGVYFDV